MKHHVIYVPGIADDIGKVQSRIVKLWRFQGVQPETYVIPWAGKNNYDDSKRVLNKRIQMLVSRGDKVSLVGASAGGCAVMNAYLENPSQVSGVAMICPKLINADNIGKRIVSKNPAFKQAMEELQIRLNSLTESSKRDLVSFISPRDGLVSYHDSAIVGVKEVRLPGLRHNLAILYTLTFGSRRLIKELRRIADSA